MSSSEQAQRNLLPLNWERERAVVEEEESIQPIGRGRSFTMFEMSQSKNEEEDDIMEIPPHSGFLDEQVVPSSVDILISPRTCQRARKGKKISNKEKEKSSSSLDERITQIRREKLSREVGFSKRSHGQGAPSRGSGAKKISRMRKVTSFRHATPRLSSKKKVMKRSKSLRTCVNNKRKGDVSEDLLDVVQREFLSPKRQRYSVARLICNQYYRVDPRDIAAVLAQLYDIIDTSQVGISKKDFFYEIAFLVANRDLAPCVWYLSEKMEEDFVFELFRICLKNHTVLYAISLLTEFELSVSADSKVLFRKRFSGFQANEGLSESCSCKKGLF